MIARLGEIEAQFARCNEQLADDEVDDPFWRVSRPRMASGAGKRPTKRSETSGKRVRAGARARERRELNGARLELVGRADDLDGQ
jgi:hypothetical protein